MDLEDDLLSLEIQFDATAGNSDVEPSTNALDQVSIDVDELFVSPEGDVDAEFTSDTGEVDDELELRASKQV